MKKIEIEKGKRFGSLTVVEENEKQRLPSGQIVRSFLCRCDCGNQSNVKLVHLNHGKIISCGCKAKTKDGEGGSHLCKLWRSLKHRTSEKGIDRHRYFDRGITVCEEWKNNWFSFREWALTNGYKKELQIDRIDNNKGYSPDNCRFVTQFENQANRECTAKVSIDGTNVALTEVLRKLRKEENYHLVVARIKRGWDHKRAIETPAREGNYRRKQKL
jgi:hypothetical protein